MAAGTGSGVPSLKTHGTGQGYPGRDPGLERAWGLRRPLPASVGEPSTINSNRGAGDE
jgi:hypothetical protein